MKKTTLFTLALVGSCSVLFALAGNEKATPAPLTPKLSIDQSPPVRSGPFGGYADIVKKVSPSVVSVFTSREALLSDVQMQELPEFFNSPMFRDFFGSRGMDPRDFQRREPRHRPEEKGLGSGVILSEDGYVLTNNHVVERASEIKVQLPNGKEYDAKTVATDPASDLAVIKVDAKGLPAATIGDSDQLKQGDVVLAIGSPFGLSHTVTQGIVSATGRDNLNITGYDDFIQTDASINPGNSGGALIDNKGRVVGINTAILSRTGGNVGIGFAIPVNMAIHIADELIDHGEISRGYLGVTLGPLNETLAKALGTDEEGVVVNDVMPGAPAEKAGFKAGDVIVAVNGKSIEDVADVRRLVGSEKPGTEIAFQVHRGAKEMTLDATIGKMPSDLLAGTSPEDANPKTIEDGALEGVRLGSLDPEIRQDLNLGNKAEGVVVLEVAPGSEAAEAGLRRGDVITEVNRSKVTSPDDAYAKARKGKGDATLLRVTDGKTNRFIAIG